MSRTRDTYNARTLGGFPFKHIVNVTKRQGRKKGYMHRTKVKRITQEAVLLKRLREQRGLSMKEAALLVKKSISWISHVENGRMDVSEEHLGILLPLYGQTAKSFEQYMGGRAYVPSAARTECLDLFHSLPDELVEVLRPIIQMFSQLQRPDMEQNPARRGFLQSASPITPDSSHDSHDPVSLFVQGARMPASRRLSCPLPEGP